LPKIVPKDNDHLLLFVKPLRVIDSLVLNPQRCSMSDNINKALSRKDGFFEFVQGFIPTNVMNGPIKLNTLEDITMGFRKKT